MPVRSIRAAGLLASQAYAGPCGPQRRSSSCCALRALHVDPAVAPALTGTCPGIPETARQTQCGAKKSRACQGSTEAAPSRIK